MSRQAAAVYDNVTPGCGHEPFSGARRFAHEPNNELLSLHCRLFHGFEAAFNQSPGTSRLQHNRRLRKRQHAQARPQRRGRPLSSSAQRLRRARAACDPAIALYDDVAWLLEWLGQDILSVAGPAYAQRSLLYDFMTAELLARVALCPHRLEPVPRTLKKGRQEFLAEARGRSVLLLPRQVSSACCCILTRRASEGSASEPALARRKICEI